MKISDLIQRLSAIKEQEGDLTVVTECAAEGPNCGSFTPRVPYPIAISVSPNPQDATQHEAGQTVWDQVHLDPADWDDVLRVVAVGV
jgi:hypothetical protein